MDHRWGLIGGNPRPSPQNLQRQVHVVIRQSANPKTLAKHVFRFPIPNNTNTDGTGGNDQEEVDQGSDPTDANDEENPQFSEIEFRVGDPSGSQSERWVMLIQEKKEDGQDGRLIRFASKNFGQVEERAFKLSNKSSYEKTKNMSGIV